MRTTRRFAQNLATTWVMLVFSTWAFGQRDPGVRGGIQNTGGGLQQHGIPIPHPPVISPNPTTGATINDNELASFLEGILRAAFQEPTWTPLLAFAARLPLWSKLLSSIHETFLRSGVNPEMGPNLYHIFQEVGLPAPAMHMETPMGSDANFTGLICDLITSVRPLAQQHNVSLDALGNLDTLLGRIHAEVTASNAVVSFVPLVGVWARKPMHT